MATWGKPAFSLAICRVRRTMLTSGLFPRISNLAEAGLVISRECDWSPHLPQACASASQSRLPVVVLVASLDSSEATVSLPPPGYSMNKSEMTGTDPYHSRSEFAALDPALKRDAGKYLESASWGHFAG